MRNIYIVNATQVVVSESHLEGMDSTVNGYPIKRSSRSYKTTADKPNRNEELI